MFKPFAGPARNATETQAAPSADEPADNGDIDELKRQMKEMQERLERMSKPAGGDTN
jgi:polyhydroxyalkanoate synthesis regulator protein